MSKIFKKKRLRVKFKKKGESNDNWFIQKKSELILISSSSLPLYPDNDVDDIPVLMKKGKYLL